MLLCLSGAARAEGWLDQAGFGRLSEYAGEVGFDAGAFLRGLLTGTLPGGVDSLRGLVEALSAQVRAAATALLRQLLIPVAVCAALRLGLGRDTAAGGMVSLVCALCCAGALSRVFLEARAEAAALMSRLVSTSEMMAPVMASACALSGATVTAGLLSPLAAEGAGIAQYALRDLGLGLCSAAGAVAVAGSLSGRFPLDRLFDLLKTMVKWLLGISAVLFGALAAVQGGMGAVRDTVTARAARSTLESLVPIIGGGLSDSAGALAVSAGTLRRAVGFTGVALSLAVCTGPVLKLVAAMLSAKLAAAVLEPIAEGSAARLAERFGVLMELLLALCLTCEIMTALLAGGCAACLGGAMG